MEPVGSHSSDDVRDSYLQFAAGQARVASPVLHGWSEAVAADDALLALICELPPLKRQPNLLFAAARWHGIDARDGRAWTTNVVEHWDSISATMRERSTQTNEIGRWATLLPILAMVDGPVALLEVGASAGLTLFPDRCSYRWTHADGSVTALDPETGKSPVVLEAQVRGPAPLPKHIPQVVWRAGIDLNPLDVTDDDAMRWLQTLVWPEHEDRRRRLEAAVEVVRREPPRIARGDLNEHLASVAAEAPADATLVVFHSAVLAYLDDDARAEFIATVTDLPGHWISNEGPNVVAAVRGSARTPRPSYPEHSFVTALDGEAVAFAEGHGRALWWL